MDDDRSHDDEKPAGGADWLERLVSGVSLGLLIAAIAYLAWVGLRPGDGPSFEGRVVEVRETANGHHVRVEALNTGDASVQDLALRVEARDGDEVVAEAEATLPWLPGRSTRQAAVVLPVDPEGYALEVVFVGYALP